MKIQDMLRVTHSQLERQPREKVKRARGEQKCRMLLPTLFIPNFRASNVIYTLQNSSFFQGVLQYCFLYSGKDLVTKLFNDVLGGF